jgi:RHS repeat-associated protein
LECCLEYGCASVVASGAATSLNTDRDVRAGDDGIVGYTHAGGVDRPLVAYKTAGGNSGAVVVPHMNWRGLFAFGTNETGGASTVAVEWPGFRTTANHSMGETQATTKNWMGSLLEGQRDAGGQMYMRNRYYDPATGQFTQTDPIGIAGGLNTYGFAAGDPVSYDDPYGLCPPIYSCLAGNGPKTAVTLATLRAGDRRHITFPVDMVITATDNTTVRGGFNAQGHMIVFMEGGVKLDTDLLPDGAERIPILMAAVNVDTGEFDVFGSKGLNFVTVTAQGNFRDGSFQGKVCVAWVKCFVETQAARNRSRQGDAKKQESDEEQENSH